MTVSTDSDRNVFTGNGTSLVFTFTFEALTTGDIEVYLDDVLQTANFTLELDETGVGGTLTFDAGYAPTAGAQGLILRNCPITQESDLPVESLMPEGIIEGMADKLTMICQQLSAAVQRCLRIPITASSSIDTELPEPVAYDVLRWNSTGTALENVSPAEAFNDSVPAGGGGNVLGPGSSVDDGLVAFNGTNGQNIKAGPSPTAEGYILTVVSGKWQAAPAGAAPPPAAFPSGCFLLWYDAAVPPPTGWALCDGSTQTVNGVPTVTPDTRGYSIIGSAESDPVPANGGYTGAGIRCGATGGSNTHTHTQQGAFSTSTYPLVTSVTVAAGYNYYVRHGDLSHAHTVTLSGNTAATDTRPLYKAYPWIIKVDEP